MSRVIFKILAFLALFLFIPMLKAADIEVGTGTADITPPKGYRMAGYFAERLNTGTRDPLLAKAIVFTQANVKAALVFCDVVSIDRDVASRAREDVALASGIPASHISISATHSHTGPLYHGVLRKKFHDDSIARSGKDSLESVDYTALLIKGVTESVLKAQKSLTAAKLEVGTANETKLAFNRRFHMKDGTVRFNPGPLNPDIVRVAGPIDPEVGILMVRPMAGVQFFAGLSVFALHLDTVGGTEYSADYPFYVEDELRKKMGPQFLSLFGTGTCGDINHINIKTHDRAKTKSIGRTLGQTILSQVERLSPLSHPSLAVASRDVEFAIQQNTPEDVARARKLLATFDPGKTPFLETVRACTIIDLADNYNGKSETLTIQAFRLSDDFAIVTLPGEVFVELGLAIKKSSPFKNIFVIELANGCPAYVPTRKAMAEGSYEVVNSRLAAGSGEKMVEVAMDLLKQLKGTTR